MKAVTVKYRVRGVCTEAEGLRQSNYIGGEFELELVLDSDSRTLLTGSGEGRLTGTVLCLTDPFGGDATAAVHAKTATVPCKFVAGRLMFTLPCTGFELTATAYVLSDGAELTCGRFDCKVTKWSWRLLLKRASGTFTAIAVTRIVQQQGS